MNPDEEPRHYSLGSGSGPLPQGWDGDMPEHLPQEQRVSEAAVTTVQIQLCELCLRGEGEECHTPGCALFLHNSPGHPIAPEFYERIAASQPASATPRDPRGPEGKAIAEIAAICDQLSLFGNEHNAQEILDRIEILAVALGFHPDALAASATPDKAAIRAEHEKDRIANEGRYGMPQGPCQCSVCSEAPPAQASDGGTETGYTTLRAANVARQAAWCPEQIPDLSFRGNELAGETGEVCNVIKKLERERLGWRGSRDTKEHLAEELADVVICADLVALSAEINLDAAVRAKFNATSEKVGLPHRIIVALPAASVSEESAQDTKRLDWIERNGFSVVKDDSCGAPVWACFEAYPKVPAGTAKPFEHYESPRAAIDAAEGKRRADSLRDQPLRCEVADEGRLSITVGVEALAFALQRGWKYFGSQHAGIKITDAVKFSEDVKRSLLHEDEQGNSLLTELFENAADKAIRAGSAFVDQ